MSDENNAVGYDFEPDEVAAADKNADRLTESGAYVGKFTKAEAVVSAEKGTKGVHLYFDSPGSGTCDFTLWTMSAAGEKFFGFNQLQGMMYLFGLKGLVSKTGKVRVWDAETKTASEQDGETFPELVGKPIGLVMQKEIDSNIKTGKTVERMTLAGAFQAETRLMASELKENKTKPAKLDRLLKGLKTIDKRKGVAAEPSQPSIGVPDGDY